MPLIPFDICGSLRFCSAAIKFTLIPRIQNSLIRRSSPCPSLAFHPGLYCNHAAFPASDIVLFIGCGCHFLWFITRFGSGGVRQWIICSWNNGCFGRWFVSTNGVNVSINRAFFGIHACRPQ
ncbi:uncharacterized protein LOC103932243 [Pyrus x bretschneideri]|uniref:uncharacterized protein LOC103932243 n=1 Tax=Pyrus x bretschneideri TaxID=225117 RepID=UPI00203044C3|nr:uncharacterized protein LOC103932243 [Pyrus x bretschneideri]